MNIQSEPSLLSVDRLTIDLPLSGGVLHPVRGVSFTVRRGEALALVGESGCGKSLTAMALMRLLPEDAQVPSGTVTLEGRELLSLTEKEMERVRGAGIAVIFQEPATSFNPVMTVGDQVAEMIRTHSTCGRTEARARAVEWLRRQKHFLPIRSILMRRRSWVRCRGRTVLRSSRWKARCRIFGGRSRAALLRRAVHGPSQSALNMRLLLSLGAMGWALCGASSRATRRPPNAGRSLRPKRRP